MHEAARLSIVDLRSVRAFLDQERDASMAAGRAHRNALIESISPQDVVDAGGRDLAEASEAVHAAELSLRKARRIRAMLRIWPGLAPLEAQLEAARSAAAAAQQLARRKAVRAQLASTSTRDALVPFARRAKSCAAMLERIDRLEAGDVSSIRIRSDVPRFEAVVAALARTTDRASVVSIGRGAPDLDLSPRSRAATIGVVGHAVRPVRDDRQVVLEANRHPDGLPGWRLLGRTWARWPQELLGPRTRSAVPLLPGSYATADRFYLPVPPTRSVEMEAAGATMGRRGGFHVDLATVDLSGPISAFLPFVAQPVYRPLPTAAIPSSSWGASLSALLSRSSWNGIRSMVFERYGNLCQICGQRRGGQHLECHEIWDYDHETVLDGMRRQRLASLACLCKSCHGAMHQGFSEHRGKGDSAAYRLADINGWTMAEAEIADECARIDATERAKAKWFLDLSLLGRRPLTLDRSRVAERNGTLWHEGGRNGDGGTRIVGVDYRIGAKGESVAH